MREDSLPDAKRRLEDAISDLIDPKPEQLDSRITYLDPLYQQLMDAVPTENQGRTGGGESKPPIWLWAVDLLNTIDKAVRDWEPQWPAIPGDLRHPPPVTVLRLQILDKKGWRPQDTKLVDKIAATIKAWVKDIKEKLSDAPAWFLPDPCPRCHAKMVWVKDSAGDRVQQQALKITPDFCQCQNRDCDGYWEAREFMFLGKLLQYRTPEGVLDTPDEASAAS